MNDELLLKAFAHQRGIEEAMMRSMLIFEELDKENVQYNFLEELLCAVIMNQDAGCDVDTLKQFFVHKYNYVIEDAEINSFFEHFKSIVSYDGKRYYVSKEHKDEQINKLQTQTSLFFEHIVTKVQLVYHQNFDKEQLTKNIRLGLSAYYKLNGMSFIGLKHRNEEKLKQNTNDVIKIATRNLPSDLGEILVGVLAQITSNPGPEEKEVLANWARVFVTTQVLNLDSSLDWLKSKELCSKTFVLDTDFLLYCLTNDGRYSRIYQTIIKQLVQCGCTLIVPNEVITDIEKHALAAISNFRKIGEQIVIQMTPDILEEKIANVFIESYVLQGQKNNNFNEFSFEEYMDNIFSKEDSSLLYVNIQDLLHTDEDLLELPQVELIDDDKNELTNSILKKIKQTTKGQRRSEEENYRLAEADATFYLTITKLNENNERTNKTNSFLKYKYYLLTSSNRSLYSAQENHCDTKNVICHPLALYSILKTMRGNIEDREISIINLFENPFLIHVADKIWGDIEPFIKAGGRIMNMDYRKLQLETAQRFDARFTSDKYEERLEWAKEVENAGYLFGKELVENDQLRQQLQSADQKIAEKDVLLKETQNKLDKERQRNHYLSSQVPKNTKKNKLSKIVISKNKSKQI